MNTPQTDQNDAVIQLYNVIKANDNSGSGTGPNINLIEGQAGDFLSYAANYAQIFSTAIGPLANGAALAWVGGATAATTGSGQAAFLTASAGLAGLGAGIVLIIAFILADAASSNSSSSSDSEAFLYLYNAINGLQNTEYANHWTIILSGINTAWTELGKDLDDLTAGGTNGNVQLRKDQLHGDAIGYVNYFIPIPPGNAAASILWQRPYDPNDPEQVLGGTGDAYFSYLPWYGPSLSLGSNPAPVSDPRSMLPFVSSALKSYLKIEMILKFIDPTQQDFHEFLGQYAMGMGSDFWNYLSFLYPQYSKAVNGIVKSDFPSENDVIGGLWWLLNMEFANLGPVLIDDPNRNSQPYWGGSPVGDQTAGAGTAFGLWCGAAEKFPPYGIYDPISTVDTRFGLGHGFQFLLPSTIYMNNCSPSCFLSSMFNEGMVDQMQLNYLGGYNPILTWQQQGDWQFWVISANALTNWLVPWIQNMVIILTMARWKAIYLYNGYDKVWSVLQKLQSLVTLNPGIVPPTMHLDQDRMIATGHWSARELCKVLIAKGDLLRNVAVENPDDGFLIHHPLPGDPGARGYSVSALLQFLFNIGNGDWGGPSDNTEILRPLSFRNRLAAIALSRPPWFGGGYP